MFLNPAFLYALPLGLIPIIIYYLMRYRSLKVVWGANYVLERALERLKKQLYLDQIILLALRTLVCIGLVLLFARWVSNQQSGVVSSTGIHRVVVVDSSYSMLAGETGATRWERSLQALGELVKTWGRGEKWSLLVAGAEPKWLVDGAIVDTPEKSLELLESLQTGEVSTSLAKALEAASTKFTNEKVELYLFVDDQATTWDGIADVELPGDWSKRVYWLNAPIENRANLSVLSVHFATERVLMKHPCRLFVTAKNFGATAVKDAEIQIHMDGAFYGRETISLLPGQEGSIHLDVSFSDPGPHYVTARLRNDALQFDNAMSAGIQVEKEIKVGVLRSPERSKKFESAWDFLQVAGRIETMKDDYEEALFTMGPMTFTLIEGPPEDSKLNTLDAILVDGGTSLTPELAIQLRDFVARGGGLVLAADEKVNPSQWNDLLGKTKLLPARLGKVVVEKLGGDRFKTLSRSTFDRPAMKAFETEEDGDLSQAKFYSWFEFSEIDESATVLAQFSDRQPFMLSKSGSLGNVILLAAGLNGRGNSLIVREFFFPFVFRLFSEAASGGIYPRTLALREPIGLRLGEDAPRALSLTIEGREPVSVIPRSVGQEMHAVATQGSPSTGLCSLLLIQQDGTQRVFYGVQGPRVDSDLTEILPEDRKAITERLNIARVADWEELNEVLKAERSGSEWHHWLAIGVLTCLIGAGLMEWRFV